MHEKACELIAYLVTTDYCILHLYYFIPYPKYFGLLIQFNLKLNNFPHFIVEDRTHFESYNQMMLGLRQIRVVARTRGTGSFRQARPVVRGP